MPLPEPRYVVTKLVGYLDAEPAYRNAPSFWGGSGASFQVIDRHANYRLVTIFRSEDQQRLDGRYCTSATRIARAGLLADRYAAKLNGEALPEPVEPVRRRAFRPARAGLLANRYAAKLNGEALPEPVEPVRRRAFRPVCPHCRTRQPNDLDTCFNCGASIYVQRRS